MEQNQLPISTNHAYKRAKQRFKWGKATLDAMMNKAYEQGITHHQTKGRLKRHFSHIWYRHKHCNNVRIYGENVYVFSNHILITLYRLDNDLIKYLKHVK